jgi:hypothetical protein
MVHAEKNRQSYKRLNLTDTTGGIKNFFFRSIIGMLPIDPLGIGLI